MNLGENIHQYRVQQNMSQGDLAEALEVSRQSVSKWENNMATPELDKLIGMKEVFSVTLDELVFGPDRTEQEPLPAVQPQPAPQPPTLASLLPPPRALAGMALLFFGMIFFLLSIFWGDHLAVGEVVGELTSVIVVLLGLALSATHSSKILSACAVIYMAYAVMCIGIVHVVDIPNYIFMFVASIILFVWFIVWGEHAQKEALKQDTAAAA